jgi:hypothetical protein
MPAGRDFRRISRDVTMIESLSVAASAGLSFEVGSGQVKRGRYLRLMHF